MKPETFRKLAAAGLSHEQMALVLEIMDEQERAHAEADEARKAVARDRVNKWRERQKADVTLQKVSETSGNGLRGGVTPAEDNNKTNNLEDISSLRSDNISIKSGVDREFEDQFWPVYPRKVGKGLALKAFRAARKHADLPAILAGIQRYAAERCGEDQTFTKHASTWLTSQGWLDEPPPKHAPQRSPPSRRERTILDVIDERLEQQNAGYDTGRTIDHEQGSGPAPVVRLFADTSRY